MKPTKLTIPILLFFSMMSANSQYTMKPAEGYSEQIGLMVYMLEDLKSRITNQVRDLDQLQTDFVYDEDANSIGALIMHLVSTEVYYQAETLEGKPWSKEERKHLELAGDLNTASKKMFQGKPIKHYLDLWDEVRKKSLEGLKTKDDAWFMSSPEEGFNYQWVWYHVMEHSAAHMGQIATIKNRLPK